MSGPGSRRAEASSACRSGFTIVELLVCIGIVAVLIGLLLPTFGRAVEQARAMTCAANLRSIGTGLLSYAVSNNGHCYPYRNWGRWNDPANPTRQIKGSHAEAYWGVAYAEVGGFTRQTYNCPSARDTDPASADGTFANGHVFVCYGLNGYYGGGSGKTDSERQLRTLGPAETALYFRVGSTWWGRNILRLQYPSRTIFAQDAYEAVLDGNGDTFDRWSQWVGKEFEYLRHRNMSSVLFADGHVEPLNRQEQSDYQLYGGKF